MTSFTFSAEQVQAAPPEVRRWMENEIVKALSLQAHSLGEPSQLQASTPAVCTIDELVQLLNLISGNFLVTRVFFELARETFITPNSLGLHVLKRNDMQRHVQLGDGHLLIDCLNAINQAFQRIRNDPTASLFAGDESGHIYIHEATYRNIRQLWEKLVLGHSSGTQLRQVGSRRWTSQRVSLRCNRNMPLVEIRTLEPSGLRPLWPQCAFVLADTAG